MSLRALWVKTLTFVYRVNPDPTISHGSPVAAQIAVAPVLAAVPDALPAPVALSADARRQAACIHVPAAVVGLA
ncbi:MAG: hypothetical protein ACRD72_08020 [Candidatus Angelobacter sp.]